MAFTWPRRLHRTGHRICARACLRAYARVCGPFSLFVCVCVCVCARARVCKITEDMLGTLTNRAVCQIPPSKHSSVPSWHWSRHWSVLYSTDSGKGCNCKIFLHNMLCNIPNYCNTAISI